MFFLTPSSIWSLTYFFYLTYTFSVIITVFYIISALSTNYNYSLSSNKIITDIVSGADIFTILFILTTLVFNLNNLIVTSEFSAWFGHVIITAFQQNITYMILSVFILVTFVFTSVVYFSSREVYDFLITNICFLYWILILFMSNSIFTTIFIIEVLSALIFLFLVTSTFSTAYFYSNLNLSGGSFFQTYTPHSFLQSLIFFFWMSLIASLNLFLFTIFLFINLNTFDWFIIEYIFLTLTQLSTSTDLLSFGIVWFVFIFSIFLKCGISPLFFWNPTFFNGIPLYSLFFYITFFYFFIFLFFIILLLNYLGEVFYYFTVVNILFITSGLFILLAILCESYYLNSFMAMSSILNSLLVFLAMLSEANLSFYFWL